MTGCAAGLLNADWGQCKDADAHASVHATAHAGSGSTTLGLHDCGGTDGSDTPFDTMRCVCAPIAYEWCGYIAAPCPAHDPFFPIV
eukprot:COSAG05_NODE_2477_length_3012_cov_3.153793_2_plen_86_part_00